MTDSFGLQAHYIDGAYVPSGSGAKFDVSTRRPTA